MFGIKPQLQILGAGGEHLSSSFASALTEGTLMYDNYFNAVTVDFKSDVLISCIISIYNTTLTLEWCIIV